MEQKYWSSCFLDLSWPIPTYFWTEYIRSRSGLNKYHSEFWQHLRIFVCTLAWEPLDVIWTNLLIACLLFWDCQREWLDFHENDLLFKVTRIMLSYEKKHYWLSLFWPNGQTDHIGTYISLEDLNKWLDFGDCSYCQGHQSHISLWKAMSALYFLNRWSGFD